MQTIAVAAPKVKAFYAHFHDEAGFLTKVDGDLLFLADGSTTPHVIEPEDVCWLAVLGEVGTAVAQCVADQLHGGAAGVACSRLQEVR
jgi:hypothetical protein